MADPFPEELRSDLRELIGSVRSQSVLLAGSAADCADLIREAASGGKVECVEREGLCNGLDQMSVFDVILLADVIEQLERHQAETVMGRLRDMHSKHLFVIVRIGDGWGDVKSHWRRNDLLAHGFSLYRRYADCGRERHLYRFELESYKATPEWLNSKYWANPELFDKYRW